MIKAAYYNACKFLIEQMPFLKNPYEEAKECLFRTICITFIGLWAWFFAKFANYLDFLLLAIYAGFSILVFYLVVFWPALGNGRWQDVINDDQYDTPRCKIIAVLIFLSGFIALGLFTGYILPWSEMIGKYN